MIVRTWRGRASKERPADYTRHFHDAVLPELQKLEGFMGVLLLQRETPEDVEIVVVTQWESLAAVKGFAGENYERAMVEPGAIEALTSFDKVVHHYEVISSVAA